MSMFFLMCVSVCVCVRTHTHRPAWSHTGLLDLRTWMNEWSLLLFFFFYFNTQYLQWYNFGEMFTERERGFLSWRKQAKTWRQGLRRYYKGLALLSVTANQGFYWLKGDAHSISRLSWPCQPLISGFWGICRTIFLYLLLLATSRLQNRKSLLFFL